MLLEAGADPNKLNSEGNAALHLATSRHTLGVLSKLLDAGADLEVPDFDGRTPLLLAAASGEEKRIRLLKSYGANTTASDNDGNTALSLALERYIPMKAETLRLLAQNKDVIKQTGKGWTDSFDISSTKFQL
ncbi:ankyrin repeat domain-containing protein 7 [Plakobranchus ocellatus]|uniref:Ankyrin repeat domain-containing protein 7 n=1 Tax=Plakobranchus ocellatus TaxID=259542 RepID=A0AAV4AZD1_9GAST|nr:ankyrin repeat domain-containing protein 7 [Plakobranchus ocellatus]